MSMGTSPAFWPEALMPVLSSAAYWLLVSLLVGGMANHLPERWLLCLPLRQSGPDAPGIRRWKRWLPDAGAALPGGIRKAALSRPDPRSLAGLQRETRRAELVHALLWAACLPTALWLPPLGVLINLVFATVFNLPCLVLQRHNRRRVQRALARFGTPHRVRTRAPVPADPKRLPGRDRQHGRRPRAGAGRLGPQNDPGLRQSRPDGATGSSG